MAKFIKSIFSTNDNAKSYEEPVEERRDSPPLDGRRQLSISRSGRLRQNTKKRHSLALELYGDNGDINIDVVEKPKSMEYHVHSPVYTSPKEVTDRIQSTVLPESIASVEDNPESSSIFHKTPKNIEDGAKSPEEEIDNAFEIIDKT